MGSRNKTEFTLSLGRLRYWLGLPLSAQMQDRCHRLREEDWPLAQTITLLLLAAWSFLTGLSPKRYIKVGPGFPLVKLEKLYGG